MQPSKHLRSSSLAHTVCHWSPANLAEIAKSYSVACSKTLTTFPDYENYKSYFEPLLFADISADLQSALDKFQRVTNPRPIKMRARREEAGTTLVPVTMQNITSNHTHGFGFTIDVEPCDRKGSVGCVDNDVVALWQCENLPTNRTSRLPQSRLIPSLAVFAIVVRTPSRNGCRLLLAQFPTSDPTFKTIDLEGEEESNQKPSTQHIWNILRVGALTTIKREFDAMENIRSSNLLPTLLRPNIISSKVTENRSKPASGHDRVKESETSFYADSCDQSSTTSQQLEHSFTAVIAEKHCLNPSQAQAILHGSTCDKGFAVIQGPPGTGKTRTLIALLNVIHMTQYQKYYEGLLASLDDVHKSVTKKRPDMKQLSPIDRNGEGSLLQSMMSAMNRTMETALVDAKPATLTSRIRRPRLLVCAPSNSAVDEVVTRLMTWRFYDGRGRSYCPELARIGAGDKVADPVKGLTAEGQAESFLERVCPEDATSEVQIEAQKSFLAAWQQKCNMLLLQLERTPKTKESSRPVIIELHEKLERMERDLRRLKIVASSGLRDEKLRLIARTYVEDAQLVFATLSGSGSGILTNSGNMESDSCLFDTVVIDEAAQATEPSSLIPMTLGCSRCLLVGDPQQLPATTLASGAAGLAYGQSLLERVFRAGMDVQLLNTQYRMHPAISSFPRRYFYSGRLKDDESVQGEHRARPFHRDPIKPKLGPYVFLDISEGEERRSRDDRSIFNSSEAELASLIYTKLKKEYPSDSLFSPSGKAPGSSTGFGVITPYKRQMQELRQSFERNGVPTGDVEIDTVDSFQGREKDVVIFSCVRTAAAERGIGFVRDVRRMNVGLTRARSTLIILGSAHALAEGSKDWAELVEDANSRGCLMRVGSVERCLLTNDDVDIDHDVVSTYASHFLPPNAPVTTQEPIVGAHNSKPSSNLIGGSDSLIYRDCQGDLGNEFSLEGSNEQCHTSLNPPSDPRRRIIRSQTQDPNNRIEGNKSVQIPVTPANLHPVGIGMSTLDGIVSATGNEYEDASPEETLAQVGMVLREAGFEAVDMMVRTLQEHVKQGGPLDVETVLAAAIIAQRSEESLERSASDVASEPNEKGGENIPNESENLVDDGELIDATNYHSGNEHVNSDAPTNGIEQENISATTKQNENSIVKNGKERCPSKEKPKEPSGWEMLFGGETSDALRRKRGIDHGGGYQLDTGTVNVWGVNDGADNVSTQISGTAGSNLKRLRGAREDEEGRVTKGRGRSRDRGRKRGRGRGRGRGHSHGGIVDEHDMGDDECGEEWMGDGAGSEAGSQGVSAPGGQSGVPLGVYENVATMQAIQQQVFQQQLMQHQMAFQPHPFQPPFQPQALQHHAMFMQMPGVVGGNSDNTNNWYTSGFQQDNSNEGRVFNADAFVDDRHETPSSGHGTRHFRGFRGPRGRGRRR